MAAAGTQLASPNRGAASDSVRRGMSLGLFMMALVILSRVSRLARTSMAVWGAETHAERFGAWDIDPSKLLVLLIIYLFALGLLLRPRARLVHIDFPLKALFVLAGYSFLSALWAYNAGSTVVWTIRLLQPIGIYLLVLAFTRTDDDLNRWGHLLMYASVLNLIGCMQDLGVRSGSAGGFEAGISGAWMAVHPTWAVLFAPFGIHYLLCGRNRVESLLGLVCLVTSLATMFISFRRAAPIAFAVGVLVYFLLVGRRNRAFVTLLALVVGAAVLVVVRHPQYAVRLKTIPFLGGGGLAGWEGHARLIQYAAGVQLFLTHPIGGIGLGGAMLWIRDMQLFEGVLVQHSLILALAADLGLIGLAIYGTFAVAAAARALKAVHMSLSLADFRAASLSAAMLSGFLGLLVWAQFHPILFEVSIYFAAALCSMVYVIICARAQGMQSAPLKTADECAD